MSTPLARPRDPASAWPRGAAPVSVLIALFGLVMALVGLAWADEGADAAVVLAVFVGAALTGFLLLRHYVGLWFEGGYGPAETARSIQVSAAVGITLLVLAIVPITRPAGTAGFGGMVVGLMVANVAAVRRARRTG